MKSKLLIFILPIIAMYGCVDIPDFSDTPQIYYNGISKYSEIDTSGTTPQEMVVVVLTLDVEDGDGDLGASSDEISTPAFTDQYKRVPGWGMPANYQLTTMTKQLDGSFDEQVFSLDSLKFFPILKIDGKPGPIKAKLDLYIKYPKMNGSSTIIQKFNVKIMDRAFHISNSLPEPTDEVEVPG